MSRLKATLKRVWCAVAGQEPEPVFVTFLSGQRERALEMQRLMHELIPGKTHITISLDGLEPGAAGELWLQLRRRFARQRIALAAVLFDGQAEYASLRTAACLLAPLRILAFNSKLERHHLRWGISSLLFLRGTPKDHIHYRPAWWPAAYQRTERATEWRLLEGRARTPGVPLIAILSPYFPYPLAHGGAVRIFNLLKQAAREFDILFFALEQPRSESDLEPVRALCHRIYSARAPLYREPRWSSILPPEVREYYSPALAQRLREECRELGVACLQVEYTALARYGGEILVEHDITFDLYEQRLRRLATPAAWWDWWRWKRFETRALRRYRRVVVMSAKDRELSGIPHAVVIPNGVDLERFQPQAEVSANGRRLLFISSFAHFPNVLAYRWFVEQVWPLLDAGLPDLELDVVDGRDAWRYFDVEPPSPRIRRLGFVPDVRPLYVASNVVIVPTLVSAGTNLKALEAMAMHRPMVSTTSGVSGLPVVHGESVWIADHPADFAAGIRTLLLDPALSSRLAGNARAVVEQCFDWKQVGRQQSCLWREFCPGYSGLVIRSGQLSDLEAIARIQQMSPQAAQWNPTDYLACDLLVALMGAVVCGFLASRETAPGEREILNLAVDPQHRRRGVAHELWNAEQARAARQWFLEVRESNTGARAFYSQRGFLELQRRPNYYSNPDEAAILMGK